MKPVHLRNSLNGERFVCEDIRAIDEIEGVEYLLVHRPNETRVFKMRRDVLVKDTTVVKGRSQNLAKI
jgi:hypothetical protein